MSAEIAQRDPVRDLVTQVRGDVFREQAAAALPPDVPVERFVRITATALLQNPDIAKLAETAPQQRSLFNALLRAASMGLMPDGHEAAVVPFKDKGVPKAQLIPMIGGFRKIAADYGWALRARVVYEHDEFEYEEGLEPRLLHRPARPGVDRGERIAVYATAQHRDGRRLDPVVLYANEVEQIRQTSKQPDGELWRKWTDRAWEKTAARRLFKQLPLAEDDRRVVRVIEAANGDPATELYGPDRALPSPGPSAQNSAPATAEAGAEQATRAEAAPPGTDRPHDDQPQTASDPPAEGSPDFEGDEPGGGGERTFTPPASAGEPSPEVAAANDAGQLMIGGSSKFKGKSLKEIADLGDEGENWFRWALKSWKSEPLKSGVLAYATVYLPHLIEQGKGQ